MHSQYQETTRQRGFSLIELMIVVVIVGILASISYPSYRDSVRKSNRTEGKALLVDAANRQERYFSNCNTYTKDMNQLMTNPVCKLPANQNTTTYDSIDNKYYQLSAVIVLTGNYATGFTLTATAQNGQADDKQCAIMRIDSLGRKTAVDGGGNDTSTTCW